MVDVLDFYATPGFMTDPREHATQLDGLPSDLPSLCATVQGFMIHVFWAEREGLPLSNERKQEVNLRSVAHKLARVQELDACPLSETRPLEQRLVGNCRDFSTVLAAILRHQGVPARARCGFGTYFLPNHYEDHWVCEYWKSDEARWVMVDAQLDPFQIKTLGIQFDPCDMPLNQFIPAGQAWQMCRAGRANPDHFGIFDMHGLWFIRGNLGRDLAALNKMELLPWDGWGIIDAPEDKLSTEDWALLDHAAELTLADNSAFERVRALYEGDERLHVPPVIRTYGAGGMRMVELAKE
jgi:hypothetical protein